MKPSDLDQRRSSLTGEDDTAERVVKIRDRFEVGIVNFGGEAGNRVEIDPLYTLLNYSPRYTVGLTRTLSRKTDTAFDYGRAGKQERATTRRDSPEQPTPNHPEL